MRYYAYAAVMACILWSYFVDWLKSIDQWPSHVTTGSAALLWLGSPVILFIVMNGHSRYENEKLEEAIRARQSKDGE